MVQQFHKNRSFFFSSFQFEGRKMKHGISDHANVPKNS